MQSLNNRIPKIDLHGESRDIALVLIKEFIIDNHKLKKKEIHIIHGIGSGILKNTVHNELKINPYVKSYRIDFFNLGTTIVELKTD